MGLNLGRTAALHFLSQVAISVSGFVATFVIARVLGADGVGIYALGLSLLVWMNLPISGIREAMKKRLSEGRERGEFFSAGVLLILLSTVVVAALILGFGGQVNRYVGAEVAVLLVTIVLTNALFKIVRHTLHGTKKVAHAGGVRATERLLRALIQVALLLLGYNVLALFFGHAVSLLLGTVIALVFIDIDPAMPTTRHFRSLLSYAKYGWSGILKGNTFNWMDTIVLGFFVSSSLVGIYEVSWTLASFLVAVSNSISSTLFPEISELSTEDRQERIHHYLEEGLTFTGVFLIPGLFGAIALGEEILSIYRPEFAQGFLVLVLLITARTVDSYAAQFVSVIRAIDRPDVALRVDFVFIATNMALNVLLVALYGWHGAAVATLLSGIVTLLAGYYALTTLIGSPSVPYREIGREVIAGAVMFTALVPLADALPELHLVTITLVFAGAAIYTTVLLVISDTVRGKAIGLVPV